MQNPAIVAFPRLRSVRDSVVAATKRAAESDVPAFRTSMIPPVVAIGYYVGSQIGFSFTPIGSVISTFWPPNAILLAGFLLTPARMWWVLLLAVLPAHLLVQLQAGIPLFSMVGWFVGNTGEALLAAVCIRLLKKEKSLFETVRGVTIFLVFGLLLAPVVSSFIDSAAAIHIGTVRSYWSLWETRLTTNMLSSLAIVPIIVTLGFRGISLFRRVTLTRYFEAGVLATCVILVSREVFGAEGGSSTIPAAFIYTPLLLLLWSAARFGPMGLSASLLVVALTSSWNAVHNRGLFGAALVTDDIMSLHCLLIVFSSTLMLIAALLAERVGDVEKVDNSRSILIQANEQERHRIARQLHTDLVGQLTLMGLSVDELRNASSERARPLLEQLSDQVYGVSTAILRLSHKIHPFNVEYLGLKRTLTKLCRDIGIEHGISVHCLVADLPSNLPLDASLRIFRLAQLALQDILERQVKTATVELVADDRRVLLRITEGGVGNHLSGGESLGIAHMREQALSLGGTFEATTTSHNQRIIETSIPVRRV